MTFDYFSHAPADADLLRVEAELRRLDPTGERWAKVIRHTYDVIYNGQETGRFRWADLMKTERTHFGTLFEIFAQREFEFPGGDKTDYQIAGVQVDAKWSQTSGGWMLPPEVFDEIALVATADDSKSVWSVGLIRVSEDVRRATVNRDQKSQLHAKGRENITWLWKDAQLPLNILLDLPSSEVDAITSLKYGTSRVDALFRLAEGRPVSRTSIATIARQLDHQKRVRYNGGSRSSLAPEGYVILSGLYHSALIEKLGLPAARNDEYISVRLVPTDSPDGVVIEGGRWRRALPDEIISTPAPLVSEKSAPRS